MNLLASACTQGYMCKSLFERYNTAFQILGLSVLLGLAILIWMCYPTLVRKRNEWNDR